MRERVTRALRRGAASVMSPNGLRGVAMEVGWVTAHAALYPLGLVADKAGAGPGDRRGLAGLSPVQRGLVVSDIEAAETPIVLVHGMVDNRSIFTVLRRSLRRRGFHRVLAINYSPLTSDVRIAADNLAERVESVCEENGFERIHLIGHSMGGLVARYYVQRLAGDDRVQTLVTLGTPHGGTASAYLIPHRLGRQLRPDSDLVAELAEPAPGCRTRFLAVWSDLDQLIVPKRAARVDHPDLDARNVLVRGVGHMSLPIHRRTVHEISTALAGVDSRSSSGMPPIPACPVFTPSGSGQMGTDRTENVRRPVGQ